MRNIAHTLAAGFIVLATWHMLTPEAHADDRNNDRIVRALERIASALENPKCR